MGQRSVGLSEEEHQDLASSLRVTLLSLRGLLAKLSQRYPRSHLTLKQCRTVVTDVQALRITLANQANVEHREAGIDYLSDQPADRTTVMK